MAPASVLRVQPLITARALRGPFDYARPDDPAFVGVGVGSLLDVPFARRTEAAVVVGLADSSEHELATPTRVRAERLPAELVDLALWIADAYASTPARALALMLPPAGTSPRRRLHAAATEAGARALEEGSGERLTDGQRRALARLPGPAGDDLALLRRLERRGLVTIASRAERRTPNAGPALEQRRPAPALTADQQHVLDRILGSAAGERLLLHGVTGSGKTEIYLRAAQRVLAGGRTVLVLVPEIGLTPQMIERFTVRFGETVAVLHSGLTDGQRYDEWQRLARGEARICIGPRSAVLAPLTELGLVIVDEEHDASYKNEGDPRYDARTLAEYRTHHSGAVMIAGSATPRPESVRRLPVLRLDRRVDGRPLPTVEIVDLKQTPGAIHPVTHAALVDSRKAIVLLNRRGWSNFLTCGACGQVWMCPNCDVALILHRAERRLACHHCGHSEPLPHRCDTCGSVSIARHGTGTERLEHELAALDRPVLRLDGDVGAPGPVLARFAAAPRAVLVGTQVVAKGHDFPDVDLAVVLDADATLRFPDFRAQERTFALITQLAGRAGRGNAGARVIVQTIDPSDDTIAHAARHDSDGFLADELERRRELRYPPFSTLIRLLVTAPEAADAERLAQALAERIPGALGPAPLFRLRGRERRQLVLKAPAGGEGRTDAVRACAGAVDTLAAAARRVGATLVVDVDAQ